MSHVYLYDNDGYFVAKVVNTPGLKNKTNKKPATPGNGNIQRFVGGKWVETSLQEKENERNVAALASKEQGYYEDCYAYQVSRIDANLLGEMNKAESLVEAGQATDAYLLLAKANGDWLQALWDFHDSELEASSYSSAFLGAVSGHTLSGFKALRNERKTFLAGL